MPLSIDFNAENITTKQVIRLEFCNDVLLSRFDVRDATFPFDSYPISFRSSVSNAVLEHFHLFDWRSSSIDYRLPHAMWLNANDTLTLRNITLDTLGNMYSGLEVMYSVDDTDVSIDQFYIRNTNFSSIATRFTVLLLCFVIVFDCCHHFFFSSL
jgi:hypothetical protein